MLFKKLWAVRIQIYSCIFPVLSGNILERKITTQTYLIYLSIINRNDYYLININKVNMRCYSVNFPKCQRSKLLV